MSRASISASRPRRGGTFRPQFEALEHRLAPGSLFGTSPGPLIEPGGAAAARERETADLAVLAGLPASHHRAPTVTPSPVVEFADHSVVRGTSILIRTDRSVTLLLATSGLPAGAYTAWWAVFDTPGAPTPSAAGRETGFVMGRSGIAFLVAHLREGEFISGHPVFPSGSLQDARQAELHFVLRYHGPVDPARLREQLTTFEPGIAVNQQVTIHLPPAG